MCKKEFKTSMELLSHKAKEHNKEEKTGDMYVHSTPKKENKESSFKFSESMLDEFL